MKTVQTSTGNTLTAKVNPFTGRESLLYNGIEMAGKLSAFGGTHIFTVNENGENVQYEGRFGMRWHGASWWVELRREGKIIFSDR